MNRCRLLRALRAVLAAAVMVGAVPAPAGAADPVALLGAASPEESALGGDARLLAWQLVDRAGAARPLELVVIAISGGAAAWRVLPVDAVGSRATLLGGLSCPQGIALTSGGFFTAEQGGVYAPLGLALGDGITLSPFSPRRWGGVLVRQGERSAIVPLAGFTADTAWDQALQSSPIVVAGSANDMPADDGRLDNRLAIGLDGDGGLVVIGAFRDGGGAVSLHTLAELILALEAAAGIAVDSALALDGGSSAQILLPVAGRSWGGALPGYMPNALCLAAPGS